MGVVRPLHHAGRRTPALLSRDEVEGPDLDTYERIIVAFSGGKDSLACLLYLLEVGVAPEKIELWHHDVDGREGSALMDWPVTRDYCRKVAEAFGVSLYFSWREGGFEREMLRDGTPTARTWFETPQGVSQAGGRGKPGTRLRFPQVSADLKLRWCSPYMKIDIGATALRNQARFKGRRTLFITGERAEESAARSRYRTFEPHRAHGAGRHVDHWRPVHAWSEADVWAIIRRWRVNPHPGYRLGWARLSCATCIFGSPDQWASVAVALPEQFRVIQDYERRFGVTIHRSEDVATRAGRGSPYRMDSEALASARAETFSEAIFISNWEMPAGAFGEGDGPS